MRYMSQGVHARVTPDKTWNVAMYMAHTSTIREE